MTDIFAQISAMAVCVMFAQWAYMIAAAKKDRWYVYVGICLLIIISSLAGTDPNFAQFNSFPPPIMKAMVIILILTVLICVSPWAKRMVTASSWRSLIGMQSFRVMPEILLVMMYHDGLVPVQMTWDGRNWDMMTALLSIVLAAVWPRLKRPRLWATIHTLVGLGTLTNILAIAILSMPTPYRYFMNEPANTHVTEFPYIWLPTIHVFAALLIHGLTLRKLWLTRQT